MTPEPVPGVLLGRHDGVIVVADAIPWPDAASAITVAEQLLAAGHPNLPEWQTGRRYPTREEDLDA